ncbi:50S ribosomal protein L23 [Mycoplasma ovis str. Michigan]|uniref:50S ribosomal protein L23 n=1 Tax=Mycoplasma ovis str. Michigan TaxID=1415773 RepID=A0ABM5P0P0_9MOLU|nr:50S ribosomal protein L23 [Mycoplasma ovis]AHC39981.1 50S ribosomal protein L23 [Mycoplasma ovis str. Michigan]
MELIDVIRESYFNKKSASTSTSKFVLTFVVDKRANKIMIKKAFHSLFGVRALAVNTVTKHPKPARKTLKSRKNFTKSKKIAYVSLLREDFLALKRALEGDSDLIEKELEAVETSTSSEVKVQAEPESVDVKKEGVKSTKAVKAKKKDKSKEEVKDVPKEQAKEEKV